MLEGHFLRKVGRDASLQLSAMPPSPPDIEIHLPFLVSLTRGILEGVNRFRAEHPELTVQIYDSGGEVPEVRHCRAVIVFGPGILTQALGKEVRATVNLSNRINPPPTHSVVNDDNEVGRLAAEYLFDRGFRSFAFMGLGSLHFSMLRFQGFRARIRERLNQPDLEVPHLQAPEARASLSRLTMPCGMLAASDKAAARTVDIALDAGLRIPQDLAVLGVDDDPICCAMSRVELSSVRLNSVAHGYQAMALVLDLLGRRRPPRDRIIRRILPAGITTRRSTDTLTHPDPAVVAVLGVLRDQVHKISGVESLARACGMSTRTLERLMRDQLASTPQAELTASRFRIARNLLIQTRLTINEVADRAGYGDVRTLIWQCKRQTGQTPLSLRKQFCP